jgi:hypothetical protein
MGIYSVPKVPVVFLFSYVVSLILEGEFWFEPSNIETSFVSFCEFDFVVLVLSLKAFFTLFGNTFRDILIEYYFLT